MQNAESSPPPPLPRPHQRTGFRDPTPDEYRISRAELHHHGRFPNGDHYYTYVVKGRTFGGARFNGFLVGTLVGLCTGAWWQRRNYHNEVDTIHKKATMPENTAN